MQSAKMALGKKVYQTPALTKLQPEEAKEFLLRHAKLGSLAAVEILELVPPVNEHPQ